MMIVRATKLTFKQSKERAKGGNRIFNVEDCEMGNEGYERGGGKELSCIF